jgi:hypothetical protein
MTENLVEKEGSSSIRERWLQADSARVDPESCEDSPLKLLGVNVSGPRLANNVATAAIDALVPTSSPAGRALRRSRGSLFLASETEDGSVPWLEPGATEG